MHDLISANQHAIQRDNLMNFAVQLKLDMARFERDLESPVLTARVEADQREGERIGVAATPSLVANGEMVTGFSEDKLRQTIHRLAAKPDVKAAGKIGAPVPALGLSLGPADAPVKVEWYSDLGSPLAAPAAIALQQFLAEHRGNVRVDFRNLPLPNRASSLLLHEFVLAAAAQGRFWDAEALVLADARPKDRHVLTELAAQLGLDQTKLWADVDGKKCDSVISADVTRARTLGISGTPTFLVDGKRLDGIDALLKLDHN